MKRFDFAIAPKELAEAMMADLGNGPTTVNGDRSSTYFLVAKAAADLIEEQTAALKRLTDKEEKSCGISDV